MKTLPKSVKKLIDETMEALEDKVIDEVYMATAETAPYGTSEFDAVYASMIDEAFIYLNQRINGNEGEPE